MELKETAAFELETGDHILIAGCLFKVGIVNKYVEYNNDRSVEFYFYDAAAPRDIAGRLNLEGNRTIQVFRQ